MNKKMRFPPQLIGAIQEGKIKLLCGLLRTGDGIVRQLDESEDRQWREALNLSIRLGSEDAMDALLQGVKFDFRQIHEALLVAVDTNQPRVVKRLLDRLDQEKGNKMDVRSFSQAIFDHSIDNSQFAPGVTPLTLACQKDLYDIVAMLTQKGHIIPWPHKISCACLECRNGRQYDLLKFSLSRINTYRGIASRAYLSITSDDPMLKAFGLSRELRKLSQKEPEFKVRWQVWGFALLIGWLIGSPPSCRAASVPELGAAVSGLRRGVAGHVPQPERGDHHPEQLRRPKAGLYRGAGL